MGFIPKNRGPKPEVGLVFKVQKFAEYYMGNFARIFLPKNVSLESRRKIEKAPARTVAQNVEEKSFSVENTYKK